MSHPWPLSVRRRSIGLVAILATTVTSATLLLPLRADAQSDIDPSAITCGNDAVAGLSKSARVVSPRLYCKLAETRDGYRLAEPAIVRYRLHLCRNSSGIDSHSPEKVRAVMAMATAQFATAGIELEEEALVRFTENDCDVSLDNREWEISLRQATPPGILGVTFVSKISSASHQISIGGYCFPGSSLCVNSDVFPELVIHEMGHFFGLAHTFECAYGMETPETCADDGDFFCDTPPDRGPKGLSGIGYCEGGYKLNGSCSGSCAAKVCTDGSKPDGYNWMSYYDCLPGRFSNEQRDFMRCTLDHELLGFNAAPPTSTSSTSTTLAIERLCGDINDDGALTAGDALGVLKAGVGLTKCEVWICDYNGSGTVSAADALAILGAVVGAGSSGLCPAALGAGA